MSHTLNSPAKASPRPRLPQERLRRREGEKVKRTILYIDDEAECLNIFQEMFGDEYDVRTTATLADARRMLAECPADIVISDQSMPEIKGTDFLAEVAAAYPPSYRVLLTGSVQLFGVVSEVGAGIVQLFVPKPWMAEDVSKMLARAGAYFESGGGGR